MSATRSEKLARALGWFSIALGSAEVLAPGSLERFLGVRDRSGLLRSYGLRELTAGVGLLTRSRPTLWVWSRVAGDALDLATLAALMPNSRKPGNVAGALGFVAAVTVVDILCALNLNAQAKAEGIEVRKAVTVGKPAEELYAFWRRLENLPQFMSHLEEVREQGGGRSRWVAKAPAKREVTWEAEITEDLPGRRIAWRSVEGSQVPNEGSVEFSPAPGDRGTELQVYLRYEPPAGDLGVAIARLFGEEPGQQVEDDLRRFKRLMEVGTLPTTDGQPSGRKTGAGRMLAALYDNRRTQ
ncbi:putative membrane protein [Deinobacterium chartae]|uniref:Putative membrane protein n=1 Tax=Deinobacterium chartae TaxID=521158 RepID=A0A841I0K7_9DEIO|nr:SRPBCC family protein [Deinobacterium chartae]MBB6098504.1 putative membrane protein [Deinobacterium chartae]